MRSGGPYPRSPKTNIRIVRKGDRTYHLSIPSRMACKSVTEILNASASPSTETALRRNPSAALRRRSSVTAAMVGFPVSRETKCSVKVSEPGGPCGSIFRLSLSEGQCCTSTGPTVTLNSRSITTPFSQSICVPPRANGLDARFPFVMTIVGNIRVIRQWRGEGEDGLRQGAIRRKTRL